MTYCSDNACPRSMRSSLDRRKLLLEAMTLSALCGTILAATPVTANELNPLTETPSPQAALEQLSSSPLELSGAEVTPELEQVTSVSQLTDVKPTDWAFQALQSLVERYGCIVGYPDRTYRGNRPLSRYEFAAGVNACLDRISELIDAAKKDLVTKEDLLVVQRLQEEFASELATLRGQIDALEVRTTTLERQQFSATTKLNGEVAFVLADAFGGRGDNAETIFADRFRLLLTTTLTGKDRLYTRLTGGTTDNTFADELGTQEGRFAFDGFTANNVVIDRLHYVFPVGSTLQVTAMASLGGHHFYVDTLNPGLEAGGGATGALSRFGERNPIYRFGLGGQGIGLRFRPSKTIEANLGYLARGGDLPTQKAGLFDGNYSALAQLVFSPSDNFRIGLTYLNGYDVSVGRRFNFGGTGTNLANLTNPSLPLAARNRPVQSDSFGVEALFNVSPQFSIRGWFGYTDARIIGYGDADIFNYALVLAFPDLGKKGNLGAIIVGAEPYLTSLSGTRVEVDVPLHIEAMYKYQLTDNISITPGVIWLTAPNQNNQNEDVFIGTIRTTFTF